MWMRIARLQCTSPLEPRNIYDGKETAKQYILIC